MFQSEENKRAHKSENQKARAEVLANLKVENAKADESVSNMVNALKTYLAERERIHSENAGLNIDALVLRSNLVGSPLKIPVAEEEETKETEISGLHSV